MAAVYFDGQSNRKRTVEVNLGPALEILEDGQVAAAWAYGDIRRADSAPGTLRLRCISAPPLARLEINDPTLWQAVEAAVPAIGQEASNNTRQTLLIVVYSAAALASFLGLLIFGLPLVADRLAPLVPESFERRLGDVADRQLKILFDGKICEDANGRAALGRLTEKLRQAGGLTVASDVQVINMRLGGRNGEKDLETALTFPGGKIVVSNGLLLKAREPDELAGVLAHEFGHQFHRHIMRTVIQSGGTGFLVGLLFGDVTGGAAVIAIARTLLTQGYSRDAERQADAFSIDTMRKLGRSTKAMGELLVRIEDPRAKYIPSIVSSHPVTEERLATMKQADQPVTGPALLSDTEWAALKNICR